MKHFLILFAAALLLVSGCAKKKIEPTQSETRDVLGTSVTINIYDKQIEPATVKPIFAEAFRMLEHWEQRTLRPGPGNQIVAISGSAGEQSVPMDKDVFDMMMKAIRLYDASGKNFDVRYGPLLDVWGFDSKPHVPTAAELDTMKGLVAEGGMFVAGNSILLAKKGMRFDVRDFAVAFAFDTVAGYLSGRGIKSALITSPNIKRMIGTPPRESGFTVEFGHPLKNEPAWASADLPAGGVAYVTAAQGRFEAGGKSYHRILNPLTGMPADKAAGTLVHAPDAAMAQAMAYGLFVTGDDAALPADGQKLIQGSVVMTDAGGSVQTAKKGTLATTFKSGK